MRSTAKRNKLKSRKKRSSNSSKTKKTSIGTKRRARLFTRGGEVEDVNAEAMKNLDGFITNNFNILFVASDEEFKTQLGSRAKEWLETSIKNEIPKVTDFDCYIFIMKMYALQELKERSSPGNDIHLRFDDYESFFFNFIKPQAKNIPKDDKYTEEFVSDRIKKINLHDISLKKELDECMDKHKILIHLLELYARLRNPSLDYTFLYGEYMNYKIFSLLAKFNKVFRNVVVKKIVSLDENSRNAKYHNNYVMFEDIITIIWLNERKIREMSLGADDNPDDFVHDDSWMKDTHGYIKRDFAFEQFLHRDDKNYLLKKYRPLLRTAPGWEKNKARSWWNLPGRLYDKYTEWRENRTKTTQSPPPPSE